MNKTKLYITSILAAATFLNIGCVSSVTSSLNDAYSSARRAVTNDKTGQNDALYAQVKQEDRDRVNELNTELEVSKQERVIASLVKRKDDLQRERSRVWDKRMTYHTKEKQYQVELAKLEAIDKNNLGDRIDNIEGITDLHVDILETQQKRLQLDGEVTILDIKIKELTETIETEKGKLIKLEINDTVGYIHNE